HSIPPRHIRPLSGVDRPLRNWSRRNWTPLLFTPPLASTLHAQDYHCSHVRTFTCSSACSAPLSPSLRSVFVARLLRRRRPLHRNRRRRQHLPWRNSPLGHDPVEPRHRPRRLVPLRRPPHHRLLPHPP